MATNTQFILLTKHQEISGIFLQETGEVSRALAHCHPQALDHFVTDMVEVLTPKQKTYCPLAIQELQTLTIGVVGRCQLMADIFINHQEEIDSYLQQLRNAVRLWAVSLFEQKILNIRTEIHMSGDPTIGSLREETINFIQQGLTQLLQN